MAQRCANDIERIKRQLADGGVTTENQERGLRSRDVEAVQAIVGKHVLPEWHATEQAPRAHLSNTIEFCVWACASKRTAAV